MKNEPIWTVAGMSAAAAAVIALLVAFGVNITQEQTAAILGVVSVLAVSVVPLLARGKVTPNDKVVEVERTDGVHVAGPASPLPTGMVIPDVDDVDPSIDTSGVS